MHVLLDSKPTNLHAHGSQKYKLGPSSKTKETTISLAGESRKSLYAVCVSQTLPQPPAHTISELNQSLPEPASSRLTHTRLLALLQNYLRELLLTSRQM